MSTTFQVLEFQQDLVEARSTESAARASWVKARVALRHAEGRLTRKAADLDREDVVPGRMTRE